MPGRVTWRRRAEDDIVEAYIHIGAGSPTAAERWIASVGGTVQFLRENASAGRLRQFLSPRAHGIRSWPVKGFQAYLIFYRCEGDNLEIIRLLHGARDLPRLLADEGS